MKTQKDRVFEFMEEHGQITQKDAFEMQPMILHLPSVIRDLRAECTDVGSIWYHNQNSKHKVYYLPTGEDIKCPHCKTVFDKGALNIEHDDSFRCPNCRTYATPEQYMSTDEYIEWHASRYMYEPEWADDYRRERDRSF